MKTAVITLEVKGPPSSARPQAGKFLRIIRTTKVTTAHPVYSTTVNPRAPFGTKKTWPCNSKNIHAYIWYTKQNINKCPVYYTARLYQSFVYCFTSRKLSVLLRKG